MKRRLPLGIALIFLLPVLWTARTHAQAPGLGDTDFGPAERAALNVSRIAVTDLRFQPDPTPNDFLIAAELLRLASELDPDEPEYLRRLIETSRMGGDDAGVIDATRRLVRLDPADTVAQLRLLTHSIARLQTVDERLDAYRALVEGPRSDLLDPSVRSRLALDASLLADESVRGEESDRLLKLAARLDTSNKEAAALLATRFAPFAESDLERVRLLVGVLMADPVDPNIHYALAGEFARAGAFRAAARFHGLGTELITRTGTELPDNVTTEQLALGWWNQGALALLETLELRLLRQREAAQRTLTQLESLGQNTENAIAPQDVRLEQNYERFRAFSALALGRRASVAASIDDLEATVDQTNQALIERVQSGEIPQQQEPAVRQVIGATYSRLITLRLLSGENIENARDRLNTVREQNLADQVSLTAMEGLLLLRTGQPGAAIDLLEPLAERSPAITLALGLAFEEIGVDDEAAREYATTARARPLDPVGIYAATRYERLTGERLAFGPETATLEKLAREELPSWLDKMVRDPSSFMRLTVTPLEETVAGLAPSRLRLSIRNTSPIPLGFGPDRPIGSRFLLSPLIEIDAATLRAETSPEVLDLSQRLRLAPREELVYEFEAFPGIEGVRVELRSGRRVRARWRVLQNFMFDDAGQYREGAVALTARTPTLVRAPVPLARRGIDAINRELAVANDLELAQALGAMRAAFSEAEGTRPSGEAAAMTFDILLRRWPALSKDMRLLATICVPASARVVESETFEETVLAESEPETRMLLLATRATSVDHPGFVIAESSPDERLRRFAGLLRERLTNTQAGYAAFNTGTLAPRGNRRAGGGG